MHRVTIEPTSIGARGYRYRVWYSGNVLIDSTRNPEFDAARSLRDLGITGKLQVWRNDRSYPCMTLDIEKAANLTVMENSKCGPRLAKWAPMPTAAYEVEQENA